MQQIADFLDAINKGVASVVRWLVLLMVLAQFAIVVGRYVFGVNSIAAQESVLYMHATLFMLAAGYTLLVDKHVRVDVFYAKLALIYWSWPSVVNAWKILEGPISVGGIKAVFLMKSLIPAFCILVLLQSVALLVRLFSGANNDD